MNFIARRQAELVGQLRAAAAALDAERWLDAERALDAAAVRAPAHPDLLHLRGLAARGRGDLEVAERWIERAVAAAPATASYWSNLGLIREERGDDRGAEEALAKSLALEPGYARARNALGTVLARRERYAEALAAFDAALVAAPGDPEVRTNRANALLRLGRVVDAWADHRFRRGRAADIPAQPWAAELGGASFVLRGEQGLGDQLFFLRFAALVARRGAKLALEPDRRLAPLLARSGFALAPLPGAAAVWMGDLPWLLQVDPATTFPPAVPLRVDPSRVAAIRARLEGRPRPWIMVTWRAGGRAGIWSTVKEVPPAALGAALVALPGTPVVLQRVPRPGEVELFAAACGRAPVDLGAVADDVDDSLAALELADVYAAVSSTSLHLRSGLGRKAHVLVPYPADWRFFADAAGATPWYPAHRMFRQQPDGDWNPALAALASELAAHLGR